MGPLAGHKASVLGLGSHNWDHSRHMPTHPAATTFAPTGVMWIVNYTKYNDSKPFFTVLSTFEVAHSANHGIPNPSLPPVNVCYYQGQVPT